MSSNDVLAAPINRMKFVATVCAFSTVTFSAWRGSCRVKIPNITNIVNFLFISVR